MNNIWVKIFLGISLFGIAPLNALHIVFVVGTFPKLSETFVLNQMTAFIDQGHEVYICAYELGDLSCVQDDVYTYRLLDKTCITPEEKQNLLTSIPVDIMYCHFGKNGIKGAKLIEKFNLSAKLITVFHGFDMSKLLKGTPNLYDELFEKLDLALPVCNYWKEKLIRLGLNPQKIHVHHMGVDCKKFCYKQRTLPKGKKIRLITVARLIEKKGIEYAIKAVAQLVKHRKSIKYTIIGDGPLDEELQQLIKKLKVKDYVKLVGPKKQDEIIQYLSKAHILLAPSITGQDGNQEGIPLAVMEAMSMGVPVISTFHSGIPELVKDGVNGFLVAERDVCGLADKIEFIVEHPAFYFNMSWACRKVIETSFNLNLLHSQLINFLRSRHGRKS